MEFGYIEKDWGCSFPKSYIWCQGNNFTNKNVSFMLSVASIPFKFFEFRGFICVLIVDGNEYKFTTYNNAKIIKYDVNEKEINITLKRNNDVININSKLGNGNILVAPKNGKMSKDIVEGLSSEISVVLKNNGNIVFSETSSNCGIEIVQ